MNAKDITGNQKLLITMLGIAIFATTGLSAAYADSNPNPTQNPGFQNQYQQYTNSTHTFHHHMHNGAFSGHFPRNGTAYNMGPINHGNFHFRNFSQNGTSYNMTSNNHNFPFNPKSLSQNVAVHNATSSNPTIPSWVKNNAKWWSQKQVSDNDFVSGLQYLIQNGVLKVPSTHVNSTSSQQIPQWVRNNANWWSTGQISDNEFLQGIQYLVSAGTIKP